MTGQKTIHNIDGTRNTVSLFRAVKQGKWQITPTTILCLPAMGVRASFYEELAMVLRKAGFNVVTADWRGAGESSVRAAKEVDWGYKELLTDIDTLVEATKKHFPNTPIFIAGHSLGGQLGSVYAARFPEKIEGLILIASCLVHYTGWSFVQRWPLLLLGNFYKHLANAMGYFPGKKVKFAGLEARTVLQDWAHNLNTGEYVPKNDNFDYEKALAQLQKHTLVLSMQGDHLAPKKAVTNLYRKFSINAPVTHLHLSPNEIGIEKLNHFNWAKEPGMIVGKIREWIEKLAGD